MRLLTAHAGKLYAGNGYWEDRPGPEGRQGAQILVLDRPGTPWRVDHAFEERLPNGRWRDLAVGALAEADFGTDGSGVTAAAARLAVARLDLGFDRGRPRVHSRRCDRHVVRRHPRAGSTGADFLPQIRSFATHRDRITGVDLVFAGEMPRGIFAGDYDPTAPGRIRWSLAPELDASAVSTAFSGLAGRLRVSSFAEANGRLYAAVGQQIYRADRWAGAPVASRLH